MIIHNARIHVMNEKMDVFEAIAIDDGKIVHIGPEREILNEFRSDKVINAGKKDIFPGFHDAHGHIMSLAKQMQSVDLRGMRSYREMITTLEKYRQKTNKEIIVGRGWDQSLWNEKSLPDNTLLNEVFPKIPVALTRIDGHAMLVNDAMLKWAGITDSTEIPGGVIQKRNGKITGILLDNAIDLVSHKLPAPNETDLKNAILAIQSQLFSLGITHVHEAGLDFNELQLFIDLSLNKELDLNIYAMLFPTDKNISFARQNGFYRTGNLSVRSFKIIADGSLGSHGACMIRPYSDSSTHGILLKEPKQIQEILRMANGLNYQVNTHCIGDSANRILLRTIDTLMKKKADHRWRIEHAQVIHPDDFKLFSSSGALPSVQPTHATTDYRWAEKHIGKKRLQGAYAYNTLYKQSGMILFGTDFPVESFDPFATIHAAVNRKNRENEPLNGFLPGEAVSVENTLKAMTVWAAYGCFEESSVGTLEKGKNANLVILDQPFNVGSAYLPNYAYLTMINGKVVFSMDSELME
ncbi:MAG: amidohydrolase [Brumimicrobium sp.]|nr:amidohydrolase [Brumimicrobium sp.]